MKEFFSSKIEKVFSRLLGILRILLVISIVTSIIFLIISVFFSVFFSVKILAVDNIAIESSNLALYLLIPISILLILIFRKEK